jgi:hypothetical protein
MRSRKNAWLMTYFFALGLLAALFLCDEHAKVLVLLGRSRRNTDRHAQTAKKSSLGAARSCLS